jgi:hypothetical protein
MRKLTGLSEACCLERDEVRVAMTAAVDPSVAPSGIGCAECDAAGGWWVHLRAVCGLRPHRLLRRLAGPARDEALARDRAPDHPIVRAGRRLVLGLETEDYYEGPELAPPKCRPEGQTVPGPRGRVPSNWADLLSQQDD